MLGNIFPNERTLALNDKAIQEQKRLAEIVATNQLSDLTPKFLNGEQRYYKTDTIYAIVSQRDQKVRWFETRADGDYAL